MSAEYYEDQTILVGQPEPIFCEFRDDLGNLANATNVKISIYAPDKTTVLSQVSMLQQSTGVYYYTLTMNTGSKQGYYQAWFSGDIGGFTRTIDRPKPLYVRQIPWNWGEQHEFVRSVRRSIGDTDPNNYRVKDRELIYYIKDAINEIQAQLPMGFTATISPDGIAFSPALTTRAETLFKWQAVLLVLESTINKQSYDVGYINTGDIVIDKSRHYGTKAQLLKAQYQKIQEFIGRILADDVTGYELITFGRGTPITEWWDT